MKLELEKVATRRGNEKKNGSRKRREAEENNKNLSLKRKNWSKNLKR